MAELTKRQALEITADLWDWLAANPNKGKKDWPRFKEIKKYIGFCALCEYAFRQTKNIQGCQSCPLYENWDGYTYCDDDDAPYDLWYGLEGEARSAPAATIARLCREEL